MHMALVSERDVLVVISASGRTPYVLGAAAAAKQVGAATVGIVNNAGTAVADAVDLPIEVLTGPEFVTGSTRLKAGTAQKLVLNMLSTIAMIHLGKVHGTLMVDVVATNAKLQRRGLRIVTETTGTTTPPPLRRSQPVTATRSRPLPPYCWTSRPRRQCVGSLRWTDISRVS